MGALNLLLFLSLIFPLVSSKNTCPTSSCNKSNFAVKFPFGIQTQQPEKCTYPGFQLSCNKQGLTSLNIADSGEFLVRHINYRTQEILVYDPNSCLAKRLQHFNLLNSPFMPLNFMEVIFLTCPAKLALKSNYTVIDCLSNSANTTLATTRLDVAAETKECEIIGQIFIPTAMPGPHDNNTVSHVFKNDLLLTWNVPNCTECESTGTKCGFLANSTEVVVCFYDNDSGTGRLNQQGIYRIISLAIAIPGIVCVFCFALFVHFITRRRRPSGDINEEIALEPTTSTVTGLDESTIQSYTKVMLGESKRLPGPGHETCAICLSEFCAKEMVRVIPKCRHCFHATCIDEWLRKKSTCPLCRNSPLS